MSDSDFAKLLEEVFARVAAEQPEAIAILGLTPETLRLISALRGAGLDSLLSGVFVESYSMECALPFVRPMMNLTQTKVDLLIVSSDSNKEELLLKAQPYIIGTPRVVLAGYGHHTFRDAELDAKLQHQLVPSFANGYPNTLIHIVQCLRNAARLGLKGLVVEFGMFKGGTTMLMSQIIQELATGWRIVGFDTFSGFRKRRHLFDMYDHQGCCFQNLTGVQKYFSGENVDIVSGDITETAASLKGEAIVLAFLDTDNYSPATAALDIIQDLILPGGAIIFDHFTGIDRFVYTLGEKLAGRRLLEDKRFFHLHGTGVFFRQS